MNDSNEARARFFYDITFFIIVSTIGLNVVFGIIVDTFSELRDEKVWTFIHTAELLHVVRVFTMHSSLLREI